MRARGGAWRWVRWRARVVARGGDGRATRVVGTVNDIDELWKDRDIARESQLRLQGIVDSAMDAIISIDDAQHITLFNRAAERIFGYESREVLGRPLEVLIPTRFHRDHHGHVEIFGRTGVSSRPMMAQRIVTALRKSGEEFPIDASISQNEIRGAALLHGDPARRVRARAHAPRTRPGPRGPARALRGLADRPRAGEQPHLPRAARRARPEPHLAQDGPRLARGQLPGRQREASCGRSRRCARSSTARWPPRAASPPTFARSCSTTWGSSPRWNGWRRRLRGGMASPWTSPWTRRARTSPSRSPRRSTASSRRASPTPAAMPRRSAFAWRCARSGPRSTSTSTTTAAACRRRTCGRRVPSGWSASASAPTSSPARSRSAATPARAR